jgi:hypothetical protein
MFLGATDIPEESAWQTWFLYSRRWPSLLSRLLIFEDAKSSGEARPCLKTFC